MFDDTIAAISTPMGKGGIAIVRVSGKDAFGTVQKIFKSYRGKSVDSMHSHSISYGNILDFDSGDILDEVLLTVMKAPASYTKENVVEINCHGGIVSVQKILQSVLKAGARIAEAGEFTKRAFLNGRIDLSQAEAVIDIINSNTELFHNSAVNQLEGSLSLKIKEYRNELLSLIANIEAAIDYPEHDIEEMTFEMIEKRTYDLISKVDNLIDTSDIGKIIREGIKTVIIGKPNVGKSSLLNTMLKEQRAIVTEIPGTTRDILEEYLNLGGIALKIIDTAGIRNTDDIVEKIGVEKSKQTAKDADLILAVVDSSNPIEKDDIDILESINNKKCIVIVNKIDLQTKIEYEKIYEYVQKENVIGISAKNNVGIEKLQNRLKDMFFAGEIDSNENVYITNVRHKDCLIRAKQSLNEVINTINMGMPEDCMSIDLQKAYSILGEITGESVDDDLVDRIFSEFCLGK